MKTRERQHLHLSKFYHPPPPGPPLLEDVIDALNIVPLARNSKQNQLIFRYLLFNKDINYMFKTTNEIEKIAKEAQCVILKKLDVLFFEGDDPDGWYLIVEGSVDVVIRFFLVAEDCLFEHDVHETTEFAPLMNLMDLDVTVDKLRRIGRLENGQIFGQHSYYLDRRRSSTIVGVSGETILIKFPETTLKNTQSLILLKKDLAERQILIKNALTRLRPDQLELINGFSEIVKIPAGRKITLKSPISHSFFIIQEGTLKRLKIVDFTKLSFRKIDASFESLELHFPDGLHPVHIDDLQEGAIFADPSISEFADNKYNMVATTDATLIALDFDYFKIVAGAYEVERIHQDLKSKISDDDVIRIWVETEKKRLWGKFKAKGVKDAHKEIKTARRAHTSTVAIRFPSHPKSIKQYTPRKVVPYASPSLR